MDYLDFYNKSLYLLNLKDYTDCKNLLKQHYPNLHQNQENFYDGASFIKFTSLHCSDCNFTIKRTHHRFFLEYVPKTVCLRKNKKCLFSRKEPMVNQHLIKVAVRQYATLSFIKRAELKEDLPVEALKVLIYSQLNVPGGGLSFAEILGLEFIPAISLKRTSLQRFSYKESCTVAFFKLIRDLLRDNFAKHVLTLLKISCLTKKYRPNFQL